MSTIKINELADGSLALNTLSVFADQNGLAFKRNLSDFKDFLSTLDDTSFKGSISAGTYPTKDAGWYFADGVGDYIMGSTTLTVASQNLGIIIVPTVINDSNLVSIPISITIDNALDVNSTNAVENGVVTAALDDIIAVLEDTESGGTPTTEIQDDYNLNNLQTTVANTSLVHKKDYTVERVVTTLFVKPYNTVTDAIVKIYVVNSSFEVTQSIIEHTFNAVADTTENINVTDFNLPIGHRIALVMEGGLSLKYNAVTTTGGFTYNSDTADNHSLIVGDTFDATQEIGSAISFGWESYEYEAPSETVLINVNDRLQKINDLGNAESGFEVEDPTSAKEPVNKQYFEANSSGSNPLYGKKLYVTGDSMAKGHTTATDKVSYYLVANRNNMTYENDGINGSWLTNGAGSSDPLIDRIATELDTDADYILINICTNDIANYVTLGTDSSTDNAEIYGALINLMEIVQTNAPLAKIGFITPYERTSNANAVVDAIVEHCAKIGVPVFNSITQGNLNQSNAAQKAARMLDSFHCNDAGHLYNSWSFEDFLKSL